MTKTIFEGYVNGKKYDNKKDFDAAVSEALAQGGELNVKSGTQTMTEAEPTYPFFGNAASPSVDYLDRITEENYKKTLEGIADKYSGIFNYFRNSDENMQNAMFYKVNNIIDAVGAYEFKNKSKIDRLNRHIAELEKQIEDTQKRIKDIESQRAANKEVGNAYEALKTKMKEFAPSVKPVKGHCTSCVCTSGQEEKDLNKTIDDIFTDLFKMCDLWW